MDSRQLDDEIHDLLSVEPSPEFVARVRLGIANEPRRQAWRVGTVWVLAGCAAIVLIAAVTIAIEWTRLTTTPLPPMPRSADREERASLRIAARFRRRSRR